VLFGKRCGKEEAVENIIYKSRNSPGLHLFGGYLDHRNSPVMQLVRGDAAITYLSIFSLSGKRFVP